jgi:hypothetical protein
MAGKGRVVNKDFQHIKESVIKLKKEEEVNG